MLQQKNWQLLNKYITKMNLIVLFNLLNNLFNLLNKTIKFLRLYVNNECKVLS